MTRVRHRPGLALPAATPHIKAMRPTLLFLAAVASTASTALPAMAAAADDAPHVATLELFGSLPEARQHCPNDAVIRIVLPDGFYLHGDRGMGGNSISRVFVCSGEAVQVFTARKTAH
jgi:hypothetical protein